MTWSRQLLKGPRLRSYPLDFSRCVFLPKGLTFTTATCHLHLKAGVFTVTQHCLLSRNLAQYLETRAASKFWCWSSKTVFHLIAAEISGMRRSLGNKYGFRFWCWNAPFLPMIAPFLPVIAPSLPVQNFHCAVFVELRHVFYIAPFLWTCAWFFCRLGMRPKFWIHESLGIYRYIYNHIYIYDI